MNPTVRNIDIGLIGGQPAITLTLDNDMKQTIAFTLDSAKRLSWQLAGLCERLSTSTHPGDGTTVGDGCSVSLSPPKEE